MKALVTGASGFIGQHLTRALTAQGHQVRALIRTPSAHINCTSAHINCSGVTPFVGDLTDAASLELDSNSVCFTTDSYVVNENTPQRIRSPRGNKKATSNARYLIFD